MVDKSWFRKHGKFAAKGGFQNSTVKANNTPYADQEVLETWSFVPGTWFFGSKYNGRKEGTMNAIPRPSTASATTHHASWGKPNNSSSHTAPINRRKYRILANNENGRNTGVDSVAII